MTAKQVAVRVVGVIAALILTGTVLTQSLSLMNGQDTLKFWVGAAITFLVACGWIGGIATVYDRYNKQEEIEK